jgi:hypothetical protein
VTLSLRAIAQDCLGITGEVSVRRDILVRRAHPPPRSLRDELRFVRRNYCTPERPTNLRVTDVADRRISVSWIDHSDNEDGFAIRFSGRRSDVTARHTGTTRVGSDEVSASLTGLRSSYEYTMSVVAFNRGGASQGSNEVRATTPARTISVSKEGTGTSTVFVVRGSGFTPNGLVTIRIVDPQLNQLQFPETAEGDGSFVSRHSVPCLSGIALTLTAFESSDPDGTFANVIVTACP